MALFWQCSFMFFNLSDEEQKRLASELIIRYKIDPKDLYKHDYILLKEIKQELRDARVFASRLNACGRIGRADIGVALCMGDRHLALTELDPILKDYSRSIGSGLNWAMSDNNIQELSHLYFLDGRLEIKESFLGPVTSILSSMRKYQLKPILSSARIDETRIKISIRKSRELNSTLELNKILIQGVIELGLSTEVGGHTSAAGAILNESDLESFINQINFKIKEFTEKDDETHNSQT